MKAGEICTAPGWSKGTCRWRVEVLGRGRNGSTPVRWLDGPLRGREARLETKTLRKESTT